MVTSFDIEAYLEDFSLARYWVVGGERGVFFSYHHLYKQKKLISFCFIVVYKKKPENKIQGLEKCKSLIRKINKME